MCDDLPCLARAKRVRLDDRQRLAACHVCRCPVSSWLSLPEKFHDIDRPLRDADTVLLEGLHLFRGSPRRTGNNRPRMTHTSPRRRGLPRDEANHGFRHLLFHEACGVLLVCAANLPDHHDCLGIRIGLECSQTVDEVRSVDRISSDPDAGSLAHPCPSHLENDFIGESARTTHEPDRTFSAYATGDNADLGLSWRDETGAVGSEKP